MIMFIIKKCHFCRLRPLNGNFFSYFFVRAPTFLFLFQLIFFFNFQLLVVQAYVVLIFYIGNTNSMLQFLTVDVIKTFSSGKKNVIKNIYFVSFNMKECFSMIHTCNWLNIFY